MDDRIFFVFFDGVRLISDMVLHPIDPAALRNQPWSRRGEHLASWSPLRGIIKGRFCWRGGFAQVYHENHKSQGKT